MMNNRGVPVPKPELDLAIDCIRTSIKDMIESYKSKHSIGGNSNTVHRNNKNESEDRILSESLSTLKGQISSSLITSVKNAVVPLEENEFKQRFIKFDTPVKQSIQRVTQNVDEMSCSSSCGSSDDSNCSQRQDNYLTEEEKHEEDEEDEEDDEDLIDQGALQRAKELRSLVREKAMEVQRKKETKISMLFEFIGKQLHEWENTQMINDGLSSTDGDSVDYNITLRSKQSQERLQQMSASLSNLESTLQSMEIKLPDTLESIQQSIDTIQRYIDKNEQKAQGGNVSNHIERAILSRLDVNKSQQEQQTMKNDDRNNTSNGDKVDIMSQFSNLDAEQRFSLFVSQMGR